MMNKALDNFDTQVSCEEEYEQLFPFEQEYMLWIEALEADFIREVNLMAQEAAVQDKECA